MKEACYFSVWQLTKLNKILLFEYLWVLNDFSVNAVMYWSFMNCVVYWTRLYVLNASPTIDGEYLSKFDVSSIYVYDRVWHLQRELFNCHLTMAHVKAPGFNWFDFFSSRKSRWFSSTQMNLFEIIAWPQMYLCISNYFDTALTSTLC